MTCDEYDQLAHEAEHGCQICRIQGEDTSHGYLVIDHVGGPPNWQVRGLLCCSCNSRLSVGVPFRPEAVAYMENAYWKRLGPATMPEPDALFVEERSGSVWRRTDLGWVPSRSVRRGSQLRTWEDLWEQYGPPLRWRDSAYVG